MEKEITATPSSFITSDLTPIVLQDQPNVKTFFRGIQVDNKANIEKNIKGSLVVVRKKPSDTFEKTKFTRRDIDCCQYVDIALDTEAVYSLAKGLYSYYCAFGGKETYPFEEVSVVVGNSLDLQLKRLLESNEELQRVLIQSNTNMLNAVLCLDNLKKIKTAIQNNMSNSDEGYWEEFFTNNAWALSQLFNYPAVIYQTLIHISEPTRPY